MSLINKFFVFLIFILIENFAVAEDKKIIYVNGINTSYKNAIKDLHKMKSVIENSDNHQGALKRNFRYSLRYNPIGMNGTYPTDPNDLNREKTLDSFKEDAIELFLLKTSEEQYSYLYPNIVSPHHTDNDIDKSSAYSVAEYYHDIFPSDTSFDWWHSIAEGMEGTKLTIENIVSDIKSLNPTIRYENSAIIVAHSQGNLLANLAYAQLASEYGNDINKLVRVINVANTAKFSPNQLDLTHSLDDALFSQTTGLRYMPVTGLNLFVDLERETVNCTRPEKCLFQLAPPTFEGLEDTPGSSRHSFQDTYLSNHELPDILVHQGVPFTEGKTTFRDRFEDFVYAAARSLPENPKECVSVPRPVEGRKVQYKMFDWYEKEESTLVSYSDTQSIKLDEYTSIIGTIDDGTETIKTYFGQELDYYILDNYKHLHGRKDIYYDLTDEGDLIIEKTINYQYTPYKKTPIDLFCEGQAWDNEYKFSGHSGEQNTSSSKIISVNETITVEGTEYETIRIETVDQYDNTSYEWIDRETGETVRSYYREEGTLDYRLVSIE